MNATRRGREAFRLEIVEMRMNVDHFSLRRHQGYEDFVNLGVVLLPLVNLVSAAHHFDLSRMMTGESYGL